VDFGGVGGVNQDLRSQIPSGALPGLSVKGCAGGFRWGGGGQSGFAIAIPSGALRGWGRGGVGWGGAHKWGVLPPTSRL